MAMEETAGDIYKIKQKIHDFISKHTLWMKVLGNLIITPTGALMIAL